MVHNKQFIELYLELPNDIKIIIMEFNSEHRRLFKKCFDNIYLKGAMKRVNHLTKIYNNDCHAYMQGEREQREFNCFVDLLNVHVDDHLHLFNCLKKCKCCDRHQTNRPYNLRVAISGDDDVDATYNDVEHTCNCRCRHAMRQLSRSYCSHIYIE